jgi:hypothetical protein
MCVDERERALSSAACAVCSRSSSFNNLWSDDRYDHQNNNKIIVIIIIIIIIIITIKHDYDSNA